MMDDLVSFETSSTISTKPRAASPYNASILSEPPTSSGSMPVLVPTPSSSHMSGRSSPAILRSAVLSNGSGVASSAERKGSNASSDSFANLVSFGQDQAQAQRQLSLQEQHQRLQEQKAQQNARLQMQFDSQFGGTANDGSTTITPSIAVPNAPDVSNSVSLKSAHPATQPRALSPLNNTISQSLKQTDTQLQSHSSHAVIKDDDPFGLGPMHLVQPPSAPSGVVDELSTDDDVLGMLARPVSDFPRAVPQATARSKETLPAKTLHDKALSELVDMGFSEERSRRALQASDSGEDVSSAVSWLLNQAHAEARQDQIQSTRQRRESPNAKADSDRARRNSSRGSARAPPWLDASQPNNSSAKRANGRDQSAQGRKGSNTPVPSMVDISGNLFKSANSLWKSGTKKLNQAMSDLTTDMDSSQPKWMRDVQKETNGTERISDLPNRAVADRKSTNSRLTDRPDPNAVTDEALLLEIGPPQNTNPNYKSRDQQPRASPSSPSSLDSDSKSRSVKASTSLVLNGIVQSRTSAHIVQARSSRFKAEDSTDVYKSPARRKRPTIFSDVVSSDFQPSQGQDTAKMMSNDRAVAQTSAGKPSLTTEIVQNGAAVKAKAPLPRNDSVSLQPVRKNPVVDAHSLQTAAQERQCGSLEYKRGDYAQASIHYAKALSFLPARHSAALPILANRALSSLKTGDPKASMADAERMLAIIGNGRGRGEIVDLGGEDGTKPMVQYWAKAMTRKAEALEQLERWSDAATAWISCIEAGVGGPTAAAGRSRCQDALKPRSVSRESPSLQHRKPINLPIRSSLRSTSQSHQSSKAITRLRAANAAADRADDEKFALADQVDSRLLQWRSGKEGNLRALLCSLENVLWQDAEWKKVTMGDVLLPGKVRVFYMKAIAKVHPDKISVSATTEQRMISAAVFATLNEAWEKFKVENGM